MVREQHICQNTDRSFRRKTSVWQLLPLVWLDRKMLSSYALWLFFKFHIHIKVSIVIVKGQINVMNSAILKSLFGLTECIQVCRWRGLWYDCTFFHIIFIQQKKKRLSGNWEEKKKRKKHNTSCCFCDISAPFVMSNWFTLSLNYIHSPLKYPPCLLLLGEHCCFFKADAAHSDSNILAVHVR